MTATLHGTGRSGEHDLDPGGRVRRRGGFAERAASFLERRVDRRGLLRRSAMAGTALAVAPTTFALRPGSAYAAVCARNALCNDGYTEFCCTITGANRCPPGTALGGWWKVDGSSFCGGGPRYYMDCNANCGGCGCGANGICSGACTGTPCGCAGGDCGNRKTGCTGFRYGQCNQGTRCLGPIVCRVVTCTPPWQVDGTCTTAARTDNATRYHTRPCLELNAIGAVDRVLSVPGGVRITGWALDPDSPGTPISINLYDCLRPVATVAAALPRPDVAALFPGQGAAHGFDVFYRLCPGERLVSVAANDTSGQGSNWIFHRMVAIASNAVGHFDWVDGGVGTIRVAGWVVGPEGGRVPVDVHVDGALVTSVRAEEQRPDVADVYPYTGGAAGFVVTVPASPGAHTVCVVARPGGGSADIDLGCRAVTVAANPEGVLESVTSPGAGTLRVIGWALDADTSGPIQVEVSVDGSPVGRFLADRSRPDPHDGHGFDVTLTGISPGARQVCVTALDVGPGSDVALGCSTMAVAAVAAGQVVALAATADGVRVATTPVARSDGDPASVRVLVDGRFRASLRPGPDGLDEELALPPGDHEVVVTATVDGPRTIPVVLTSANIVVAGAPPAPSATPAVGSTGAGQEVAP